MSTSKDRLEKNEKKRKQQEFPDEDSNSEDEDEAHSSYCEACDKLFNTVKAFQSHRTSKEHKENVSIMIREFMEDDESGESDVEDDLDDDLSDSSYKSRKKIKKKLIRKKQKTVKLDVTEDEDEEKMKRRDIKQEEGEDLATSLVCVSCNANFPSKNELFDHLKMTGHSIYLPK